MASAAVVDGVSGAIGGIVATVATYPLITVTTRQATRVKEVSPEIEGAGGALKRPARQSTVAEILEIVRTSGWESLFGGLGTALFGTTVSQGIYFYLYSLLRALAVERRQEAALRMGGPGAAAPSSNISVAESLLVASLAGMGNVLLTNPIWMIATRMQTQQRKAKAPPAGEGGRVGQDGETEDIDLPPPSFLAVVRSVYSEYGVAGFWRGVSASLVMVCNPTIQYALYEWLMAARARVRQRQLRQQLGKAAAGGAPARPGALEVFLLSALAKAGATVVTYPLLTIKTRLYTARRTDKHMQYSGIADAAVQILRKEGVAGLYKGINSKIVQSVLAAALLFMCKEQITDFTRVTLALALRKKRVVRR